MDEFQNRVLDKLAQLPIRATVAFAARCARRVEPAFACYWLLARHEWPKTPVNEAILAAEHCAASQYDLGLPWFPIDPTRAALNAAEAATEAAEAADQDAKATRAARRTRTAPDDFYSSHAALASIATHAAHAAAYAARAAYAAYRADQDASRHAACAGVIQSTAVAAIVHYAGVAIIDLDLCLFLSKALMGAWNDETRVSSHCLGPMWPDGEPNWTEATTWNAKWPQDRSLELIIEPGPEDRPLELIIEPGDATKKDLADVFFELSKLYKMAGGSGIDFRIIEARNPAVIEDHVQ